MFGWKLLAKVDLYDVLLWNTSVVRELVTRRSRAYNRERGLRAMTAAMGTDCPTLKDARKKRRNQIYRHVTVPAVHPPPSHLDFRHLLLYLLHHLVVYIDNGAQLHSQQRQVSFEKLICIELTSRVQNPPGFFAARDNVKVCWNPPN